MTVKKKLNSNFVRWNKTQLKSSSSIAVDVGKKSTWWVAFLPLQPQIAQHLQDVISLLFHSLSMGNISKITTKFSGLSVWTRQFHSVDPYCWMDCTVRKKDRRADWSVQKARTEAVRRGEKIQFDGSYLTRGHYSSGATFHDAKTGKIILRTLSTHPG